MMGNLSDKYLSISKDAEPEPITTPALNSIVGTPEFLKISPVILRDSRCWESF